MSVQKVSFQHPELTHGKLRTVLLDENDDPITAVDLTELVLTLRDTLTGQIINERDRQSVLNANGGTLDDLTGAFVWAFTAQDMAIVHTTPSSDPERHRLTISAIWDDGDKQAHLEVVFVVSNKLDVPQVAAIAEE